MDMKEFWQVFTDTEKQLVGYIEYRLKGGLNNMTEAYIKTEIITAISKIHPDLWINLGRYAHGDYVFLPCLNPWEINDKEGAVKAMEELLACKPTMEGWEFRAMKPTDLILI